MRFRLVSNTVLGAALVGATVIFAQPWTPGVVAGTFIGPSSSQSPYVNPTAPGWEVVSLITTGDEAGKYTMAGIPDGLGAIAGKFSKGEYDTDKSYMTVFMNHEISAGLGDLRAHGENGAFVSQWTISLNTLDVKKGEDLIQRVFTWDPITLDYVDSTNTLAAQFSRFCSADLARDTAFFNPQTGRGFDGRIFMDGEESGSEGRAMAHIVSGPNKGDSYQLPWLGRMAFENTLAHPNAGDKTLVMEMNDTSPSGQIYLYVGTKQSSGGPIARAGLRGGNLYGIKVTNGGTNYGNAAAPFEDKGVINGTFTLQNVSDVAMGSGATLFSTSRSRGVTEFARPEDGNWDTVNPNVFYFVVTGATVNGQAQSSRLYKLTFDSIQNPTGGTISLVVDSASLVGTDGAAARFFDNITVDGDGNVMVQEDPGGNAYIAKTWKVRPTSPAVAVQIAESDRARFAPGGVLFHTIDEESSGIIEVTDIVKAASWYEQGRRYFLADLQDHLPLSGELVEGGQLYMLVSPRFQ